MRILYVVILVALILSLNEKLLSKKEESFISIFIPRFCIVFLVTGIVMLLTKIVCCL